ncbi:hypothetical protein Gilli_2090 [Gillisia limnaea DSM 15749]|uniref:Uncharacterized protein n=1 Tax=Gillisia limnaea (strain DSM 15749 / LMG 21470 / R-8282) TaxID=865937 RepID=H2BU89_GILLR|nr:hypothetical protein Gilli_2090 [Gillisia limnaea DSM 15749]
MILSKASKISLLFFLIFLLGVIGIVALVNKTLNKKSFTEIQLINNSKQISLLNKNSLINFQ